MFVATWHRPAPPTRTESSDRLASNTKCIHIRFFQVAFLPDKQAIGILLKNWMYIPHFKSPDYF